MALSNDAGRTLGEVSAKNAASTARDAFGHATAQVAKAAARDQAWSKPTPAESAQVTPWRGDQ